MSERSYRATTWVTRASTTGRSRPTCRCVARAATERPSFSVVLEIRGVASRVATLPVYGNERSLRSGSAPKSAQSARCSRDVDRNRTAQAARERIGRLRPDAQAHPVGLAGRGGTEAVDVAEVAVAVRADGREGAPPLADARLELDHLAGRREVAAEDVTGEAHRPTGRDGGRVGADPTTRRRADARPSVGGQEERVAREGEPDRTRWTCGQAH